MQTVFKQCLVHMTVLIFPPPKLVEPPSAWEAETGRYLCEFEASLAYIVSIETHEEFIKGHIIKLVILHMTSTP